MSLKHAPSETDLVRLQYKLETYTETRTAFWEQDPYRGQDVDAAGASGAAPQPWSIKCEEPTAFTNQTQTLEVPHTAVVLVSAHARGHGSALTPGMRTAGDGGGGQTLSIGPSQILRLAQSTVTVTDPIVLMSSEVSPLSSNNGMRL